MINKEFTKQNVLKSIRHMVTKRNLYDEVARMEDLEQQKSNKKSPVNIVLAGFKL